jgi:hypothetical protein
MSLSHEMRRIRHFTERLAFLVEIHAPEEALLAAIDDLTASITTLETTATAVEAEVNQLKSGDEAALAALNTRVQAVNTGLAALVPAATSNPQANPPTS